MTLINLFTSVFDEIYFITLKLPIHLLQVLISGSDIIAHDTGRYCCQCMRRRRWTQIKCTVKRCWGQHKIRNEFCLKILISSGLSLLSRSLVLAVICVSYQRAYIINRGRLIRGYLFIFVFKKWVFKLISYFKKAFHLNGFGKSF